MARRGGRRASSGAAAEAQLIANSGRQVTIQRRPVPKTYRLALVLLVGTISCTEEGSGPPLITQRDSAGTEIIEAMRPLWGESSLWSIDPDPLVDLTVSGSGRSHEFFGVRGVRQRPDSSLVLADGSVPADSPLLARRGVPGCAGRIGPGPRGVRQPSAGAARGRHCVRPRRRRPGHRGGSPTWNWSGLSRCLSVSTTSIFRVTGRSSESPSWIPDRWRSQTG